MKIFELKKEALQVALNNDLRLAVSPLLEKVLGWDEKELFLNAEQTLTEQQINDFWEGWRALEAGRPLAQILGYKEFYGFNFQVNENVLIPRPETEQIVELAREVISTRFADTKQVRVLDVGTGSGCILLSLAQVEKRMGGLGVDVSEEALEMARLNAQKLGVVERVKFRKSNLLEMIRPTEQFDLILANLPYIGTEKFNFVARDVERFEPAAALFGGSDGLELYRCLFEQVVGLQWRPAALIGEFGFGQQEDLQKLIEQRYSAEKIQFAWFDDLAGIPRNFVIKFN